MILQNKKTGEIKIIDEVLLIRDDDGDCWSEGRYASLAELNEEWEDYESAEPLIKDEKIRKAVRAWAEINSIEKARVNVSSNGARGIEPSWFLIIGLDENGCSWEIEIHADYFEAVSKCYKGDMVGIAELCGEDAPEPTEPTFVDLDERIKEKEKKPRPVIANGVEYDSYADYLDSREEEE